MHVHMYSVTEILYIHLCMYICTEFHMQPKYYNIHLYYNELICVLDYEYLMNELRFFVYFVFRLIVFSYLFH